MKTIYNPKDLQAISRRVAWRKFRDAIYENSEAILAVFVFVLYFVCLGIFD